MKAAIFNPYLDTLGGGERYSLAIAQCLVSKGYKVYIEWSDPKIDKRIESRFGIKIDNIEFIEDIKRGDGCDVCFWVSDGSIPLLHARNNILHFQVPFTKVNGSSLLNKFKLFRINSIVCNSNFTKQFIDLEFAVKSRVLYPPVSVDKFNPSKKKTNVILFVGRFSTLLQSKRQDILINVFKNFCDSQSDDWKLILAGGSEVGSDDLLTTLRSSIGNYPIEIIENPSFSLLKKLYSEAVFFWSASGYGVDQLKKPALVEHFGITVVEAMSAGCIPLVFNAGGHREIINKIDVGFLWQTEAELLRNTNKLIKDSKLRKSISSDAVKRAQEFSYENFLQNFSQFI